MKKAVTGVLFSIIFLFNLTGDTIQDSKAKITEPETLFIKAYFKAIRENDKDVLSSMALSPRLIEFRTFAVISMEGPAIVEFGLPMLLRERLVLSKKKKAVIFDALDKMDEAEELRDTLEESRDLANKEELERKIARCDRQVEEFKKQIKKIQVSLNDVRRCIETEKQIFYASIGGPSGTLDQLLEKYRIDEIKHRATVRVKTADGESGDYHFLLRRIVLRTGENQIVRRGGLVIADIIDI